MFEPATSSDVPYSSSVREAIQQWVEALPVPEPLAVMLLAALPVTELRLSIPFARGVLDWSVAPAFIWSVVGNLLPVPFILWWLGPVTTWAERHWSGLHRFLERLFSHTQRRHSTRFDRLRDLALITFVAIPLPITGAWSGSLAAFVFGVERRRALVLIAAGVVIAAVIVTVLVQAGVLLVEA
jgi:uncharacterized membrane protein